MRPSVIWHCVIWEEQDGRGDFRDASRLPTIRPVNLVSAENLDRFMEEQLRNADSILHPDWLCRDGAFEFDRFWLVWDREDLERLAGWLLDPMKALHASGHRVGEIAIPMPAGGA